MIEQLTTSNLHLGCQARNKAEVLKMVGTECKNKGYVDRDCVHFLTEREQQYQRSWGMASHCHISLSQLMILSCILVLKFFNSLMVLYGIEPM